MDDVRVDERDYQQCLADLAAVNRVTRTHAPIVEWVCEQVKRLPRRKLVVLDVAFGQGDLLRELATWALEHEVTLELHGVDLNPRSAVNARAATAEEFGITFHTADVFAFSPPVQPDLIVSSQFTHHLEERDVVRFLRWLERTAKRAWFIADLERNAFAFHGFPLLCAVAGWHPIVERDGQVSIARAFRREEWRALVADARVEAVVTTSFPFRLAIQSPRG